MTSRRILETAGFITIAAALHVSAAAFLLPEQVQQGDVAEAPPAALAAGGEEVQAMVSDWETPPELEMPSEMAEPQPQPQPEPLPELAAPEAPPVQMALAPPPMAMPDPAPARPNLPEPPAPRIDPAELDLPELQSFDPPVIETPEPALTLAASARPERRPERQPARQPERQQAPREAPAPAQPAPAQSAPQRAGQGGQSQASSQGGGGGGASAQQRASLQAQWGGQIRSCISRRASAPRGARQGGRVVLALTIGRDGRVQGVGVAGSSGQPALDQAAVSAAQRAGRCPAAPAGLTEASYSFQLPISLDVR